ncbi:MAG: acyltransferase [Thiotrichaceae bacterium]|nr:acyltransferase [Thiotrichaceae bacterium]
MLYRKEIDGLRALAVIPVILFHGGLEWFSRGYVGVDVFFVISGYLITSIILKEKEADTFSIAGFYERRARRILPALFFIIFICIPFAWFWLLPHELKDFGKSIVAVTLFASNILFWRESDYFAPDAELIPLLHTWSLAVEEQFYVIFPLIMIFFWAFGRRRLIGIISLIALLSLALTEWGWRHFPEANFYLIPTRAWELMIGALVAFYLYQKKQPQGNIRHLGSLIGIGLIVLAIFFLDKTLPFPSLYALAPTIGTALIILFATPDTLVYKLLSQRIFVGIGLISYSAYLWHQPIFVFARIRGMDEPNIGLVLLLSMFAIVLAYFSWRFIELPFRDRSRFTRKQIFSASLIASLTFIGIGSALVISDGAMFRFL